MMDQSEDQLLADTPDTGENPSNFQQSSDTAATLGAMPAAAEWYRASEKWLADTLRAKQLRQSADRGSSGESSTRSSSESKSYSTANCSAYPHSTVHGSSISTISQQIRRLKNAATAPRQLGSSTTVKTSSYGHLMDT